MVKYLSLLVSQHGERFECLDVASITVCVHWFWTLFSNLAFAQVEEWWTMCLYLFLDLLSTMSFLVLCTERFAGLELVRLPPGAGTKWAGRWSFANVPQTKENKASRRCGSELPSAALYDKLTPLTRRFAPRPTVGIRSSTTRSRSYWYHTGRSRSPFTPSSCS